MIIFLNSVAKWKKFVIHLFSKKVYTTYDKDNTQSKESPNRPWYDEECRHFRILFNSALNTYRRDKSALNQSCLVEARSKYMKILRHKRHKFMKEKTCNLIISKSKNVKEYWKLFKQAAHITNKCSIDAKVCRIFSVCQRIR